MATDQTSQRPPYYKALMAILMAMNLCRGTTCVVCPEDRDWRGSTFIFAQPGSITYGTTPPIELHLTTVGSEATFTSTVNGGNTQTRALGPESFGVIKYSVGDLTKAGSYIDKLRVKVAITPGQTTGLLAVANMAGTTDPDTALCGMSAIYPTDQWGYDYFLLLPRNENRPTTTELQTLTITTDTDNTLVLVQFRGFDLKIILDGRSYSETKPLAVTLAQSDVIQIQETSGADMSGTRITATQKIAVFGGITQLRYTVSFFLLDSVFEQMPRPIYVTSSRLSTSHVYVMGYPKISTLKMGLTIAYKIVSLEENNKIYDNSPELTATIKTVGGFHEASPASSFSKYVRVQKSALLALIVPSTSPPIAPSTRIGSPALVFIQPDTQWKHTYIVTIPATIGPFTTAFDGNMKVAAVVSKRIEWGTVGGVSAADIPITVVTVPVLPAVTSDTRPVPDGSTVRGNGFASNLIQFQVTSYDLTGKTRATFTSTYRAPDITGTTGRPDTDFGLYVLMRGEYKGTCFMAYSPDGCYSDPNTITGSGINSAVNYATLPVPPLAQRNEAFSTCSNGKSGGGRFSLFMPVMPGSLKDPEDGWTVYAINTGYEHIIVRPVGTIYNATVNLARGEMATFRVSNFAESTVHQPQTSLAIKLSCELEFSSDPSIVPRPSVVECSELKVYASSDMLLDGDAIEIGVTPILPDSALDNDYLVMVVKGQSGVANSALVGIVATEPNVVVTIAMNAGVKGSCTSLRVGSDILVLFGTSREVLINNPRDTIVLSCSQADRDISGLRISAPTGRKLAVFSGGQSIDPGDPTAPAGIIWEQLIPTSRYGLRFVLAKPLYSDTVFFKILARDNNTLISVKGRESSSFQAGQVYDNNGLPLEESGPLWISANRPVMVGSFTKGQQSLQVLPAVEHWESAYTFVLPRIAFSRINAYIMLTSQFATDKILVWFQGSTFDLPQSPSKFNTISNSGWENVIGSPIVSGSNSWKAKTVQIRPILFEESVTFEESKSMVVKHSEGVPFGVSVFINDVTGTRIFSAYNAGACFRLLTNFKHASTDFPSTFTTSTLSNTSSLSPLPTTVPGGISLTTLAIIVSVVGVIILLAVFISAIVIYTKVKRRQDAARKKQEQRSTSEQADLHGYETSQHHVSSNRTDLRVFERPQIHANSSVTDLEGYEIPHNPTGEQP